ncbi:MAG: hypothetical protein HY914_11380 [Desulfomonile tiedjei]|nr:hypothetical protein [Desulfomonile tiedjei]
MRRFGIFGVAIVWVGMLLVAAPALAQDDKASQPKKEETGVEEPGKLFDMKIPAGFKAESVDEPGVSRWKKDTAEILVAVGDLFLESGDVMLKSLKNAVNADSRMEKPRTIRVNKGRAILYKEKPPEDQARLRTWRLVVVTNKTVISVDFSAPGKDFDTFAPGFEEAVKSFKLKATKG